MDGGSSRARPPPRPSPSSATSGERARTIGELTITNCGMAALRADLDAVDKRRGRFEIGLLRGLATFDLHTSAVCCPMRQNA